MNKEKIKKEIDKLKNKLISVRSTNRYAWNMYGSELCSYSMEQEELNIEKKIHILSKQIGLKCNCYECSLKELKRMIKDE